MKEKDFDKRIELSWVGGGFIPCNENANNLTDQLVKGEVITFMEVTARDISFHRCYMSLLAFIWGYMTPKFKKNIPLKIFYKWLKHLKGEYKVDFEFKDGTRMVTYESIAFGNMSQQRFKEYVKEQLPFIYTNVIGAYYKGEIYDSIISTIETEYEKFFAKL